MKGTGLLCQPVSVTNLLIHATRRLCELSYADNVRSSYNVEVCNFVVTGTVGIIGKEIGIRASEVKWRDGRNLADEKVERALETLPQGVK